MKKTLLELMVECEHEWPDGAEFASQDKRDKDLYFYRAKPERLKGDDHWSEPNSSLVDRHTLPSLCKNWHQTIVTREQYEAAKANLMRVSDVSPDEPVKPAEKTIEQVIAAYRAAKEELSVIDSEIKALMDMQSNATINVEHAHQLVSDALAAAGYDFTSSAAPTELNITDWRDLQVGDIIECLPDGCWYSSLAGKEARVIGKECLDYRGAMSILVRAGERVDWGDKFKFIRRPTK